MRILELNSGCGGMSLGFARAGLPVTWAIDNDPDACASYRSNFADHAGHQMIQRDIRTISGRNWTTPVELLVADTPCQPYSSAGKGLGADDDRCLLGVTVDLVVAIRPPMCLISNVPGLTFARHANALNEMIQKLTSAGYCVDFLMLNGADIGLPQIRRRPFWFGHLEGNCPRWPTQTHWKPRKGVMDMFRPRWRTIGDAMVDAFGSDVSVDDLGRLATIQWKEGTDHRPGHWRKPARTMTANPNCDGALLDIETFRVSKKHPPSSMDLPFHTITGRPREANLVRLARDGQDVVVLNERARLVLQGFPADWTIVGNTQESRDSQIGLAMPPPMACAVATAIKQGNEPI